MVIVGENGARVTVSEDERQPSRWLEQKSHGETKKKGQFVVRWSQDRTRDPALFLPWHIDSGRVTDGSGSEEVEVAPRASPRGSGCLVYVHPVSYTLLLRPSRVESSRAEASLCFALRFEGKRK